MNFQEFWRRLQAELQQPKKLPTLAEGETFEARVEDPNTISVVPQSTKELRSVQKSEFQDMWDIMKNYAGNERYISTKGRYSQFYHSSYVRALVHHIVGGQNMV